jgi:hypothetical protein
MTPRSLFTIILKALGIFFVKDIVLFLPQIISVISIYSTKNTFEGGDVSYWLIGALILGLGLYIYIPYFLIFRTEKLINLFHLDKGFDEELFELNISSEAVYIIAIVVTGLFLVITEIPTLCSLLFNFFDGRKSTFGGNSPAISFVIVSVVKILAGLLLIGERSRIASLFKPKKKETEEEEEEA